MAEQVRYQEAGACFHGVYNLRAELFGKSDPRTIKVRYYLSKVLAEQTRYHEASLLFLSVGTALALRPPGPTEEEDLSINVEEDRR